MCIRDRAQDKKRKEGIDARNDADSMVFQTEKALQEVGDKIDANDKAAVEADLNALKEAINRAPIEEMTDAQIEDIKAGKEKLMNSAQALFCLLYTSMDHLVMANRRKRRPQKNWAAHSENT